nr:SMEK domain-containing protein [Leptospira bandrabouensis]
MRKRFRLWKGRCEVGREEYLGSIVKNLNLHRLNIKSKNQSGFTDSNRSSQNLFANFLNILYGWNLELTDKENPNYPAIDLADKNSRISVQVTSDTSLGKIQKTIDLFEKHNLESEYDRLVFLFIGEKVDRKGQVKSSKLIFNIDKDCIYIDDLIKECYAELDTNKLKQLSELLESEIGINSFSLSKQNEDKIEGLKSLSRKLLEGFKPPNLIANFSKNIVHEKTIEQALTSPRKLTFQKQNKTDNSIEINEILKSEKCIYFIEGLGGMGKTHLLWNFAKNLQESEYIPIYLSLSNFSNVESIDEYFKLFDQNSGLNEISKQPRIIFLLDGWTEFALTNNNRSEHSKLLSLISSAKVIATGRFITESDVAFEILKLEGFRKSEIEKFLNKTPSDEIIPFLEYPLFFILYVYLNETISKPYDLLYQFYLKITEKFEDNSKFLNILSFVAAKIEIDNIDKTWINFEKLISDEAQKNSIRDWKNLLISSGIIRNLRDRLEPTHDIYWEWLVGIGLHLNWKEWGKASLTSLRLRDSLRLSIGCLSDVTLNQHHYDLIQTDIDAFSIFYPKANTEKKKEFDTKLLNALESKDNSVAFDAIYCFFQSESVLCLNKAKTATHRLLNNGFYFPNLKEKISNTFLWNHKEDFLGWITDEHSAYFIIEAIQNSKDEKWAKWIESIYRQGLIPFPTALQIFLSTSGDFPDWIRDNLTEFIQNYHAYHLKPASQLGKNHQLAKWLFENYSSILGEKSNSDFLHINDLIFSCANSELLNRIELSFNTLESRIKELLMYGIRTNQPEMAINIARSYQFNSEREISYFDAIDLSAIEEEIIRCWMIHPELTIQDLGWKTLAKKFQHQMLDEIESSLPGSFDSIDLCPPLRALSFIKNLPRKWEDTLASRVKGAMHPMLTVDLINAFTNIDVIGPISFYKCFIEQNPTFLPTYHLHLFLKNLINWEKEKGLELRLDYPGQNPKIKLTDWLIYKNLARVDIQDSFIADLINLISTPEVKKEIAELLKNNAHISIFFQTTEQKQKKEVNNFKKLIYESNYEQAYKKINQCINVIETKDLLLLLDYYRESKNYNNVESILYHIAQRNQEKTINDLINLLKYYSDKELKFKEIRILSQITTKLSINNIHKIFYPYVFIKNKNILSILKFSKYFSDSVCLNDKFELYFYQQTSIIHWLAKVPILRKIIFRLMVSNNKN